MIHSIRAIRRAVHIKRTLGMRAAAGYLRNRGYSLAVAMNVLVYP